MGNAVRIWLPGILLGLALGCSPAKAPNGRVDGRVTWQEEGVPGALVQAFTRAEQDRSVPPVAEGPSDEGGHFGFDLPPGRYWIWARATLPGDGRDREVRLVGQARDNPILVPEGTAVHVEMPLSDPSGFTRAAGPAGTGVQGRVTSASAGKTTIYAYPGEAERPVGPGFAAATPPETDGSFRLDLPPGRYTLSARQRASGRDFGALTPGDLVDTKPVEVIQGSYTDVGTLHLRPADLSLWQGREPSAPASATSVSGRVVGSDGTPVAGIRVLAFRESRMSGKPEALSSPTGPDGEFRIDLPGGGTFFLGARSRLGGPAEPGEKIGSYRGTDGAGVSVSAGQAVGGISIPVEEVW